MIALVQGLIKYSLFPALGVDMALSNVQFLVLVAATLCIAAAGNVVNDIYDVEVDLVNKPEKVVVGKKIPENSAFTLFIILNITGVAAGFYLANSIEKPVFSTLFIVVSALLYMYATYLKGIPLLGNVIVSLLVGLSILIVGIFDLVPPLTAFNREAQVYGFQQLFLYAGFAFYINLIREIVKDLQDINGDRKGGVQTIPILLGRTRTTNTVFVMGVMGIAAILYYLYMELYQWQLALLYFLFLVIPPLIYFCIKAWNLRTDRKETSDSYGFMSLLLKITMLLGVCSLLLYKFV